MKNVTNNITSASRTPFMLKYFFLSFRLGIRKPLQLTNSYFNFKLDR